MYNLGQDFCAVSGQKRSHRRGIDCCRVLADRLVHNNASWERTARGCRSQDGRSRSASGTAYRRCGICCPLVAAFVVPEVAFSPRGAGSVRQLAETLAYRFFLHERQR